mgnify:CR=1 FL=1
MATRGCCAPASLACAGSSCGCAAAGVPTLHTPEAKPRSSKEPPLTTSSASVQALQKTVNKPKPMVCLIFVAGHDDLLEREIALQEAKTALGM